MVDVSVESPLSEAMILDFREWYDVTDWRVRSDGDRVRHEFRVYWDPADANRRAKASPPGVWPMTILACPEAGGGPVLACSHSSCEVYESEDAVPQVVPWYTRVLFRSPWGYGEVRELQEGRTLDIPLSYVAYRDIEKIQFIVAVSKWGLGEDPSQDLEAPRQFEVGPFSAGESGTFEFRVKAIADGKEEAEAGELFLIAFLGAGATFPNTHCATDSGPAVRAARRPSAQQARLLMEWMPRGTISAGSVFSAASRRAGCTIPDPWIVDTPARPSSPGATARGETPQPAIPAPWRRSSMPEPPKSRSRPGVRAWTARSPSVARTGRRRGSPRTDGVTRFRPLGWQHLPRVAAQFPKQHKSRQPS